MHRYCCGPALAMTVEVPQIQFLARGSFQFLGFWMYIDNLVMYLWLCSDRSRCFLHPRALHTAHYFCKRLYLACTWPGVHAPVYGSFWKNLSFIHVVFAPEPFAPGNLDTAAPYMFFDCSLRLLNEFPVFFREGELGSCGRFTSCSSVFFGSCTLEKCAQSSFRLRGLLELCHLESGHYFHEPFPADRHLAAVSGLHEKSLGELITQMLSSISLSDCCIVITVFIIHTVEHTSEITTTGVRPKVALSFVRVFLSQTLAGDEGARAPLMAETSGTTARSARRWPGPGCGSTS